MFKPPAHELHRAGEGMIAFCVADIKHHSCVSANARPAHATQGLTGDSRGRRRAAAPGAMRRRSAFCGPGLWDSVHAVGSCGLRNLLRPM
jgi:hypothetical protein